MNPVRSGRARLLLASGALVACGIALTAAAFTDSATVAVELDGSKNHFDLVVAGYVGDRAGAWRPEAKDWRQGNPGAYELSVSAFGSGMLAPGSSMSGRIAVRNDSPRLDGNLSLTIGDPLPRGDERDPHTGRFVELFDQLIFSVSDESRVLIDRVPAADLTTVSWPEPFAAGDVKVLDVTIEMSSGADNRWQLASTDVQFGFEAVSS